MAAPAPDNPVHQAPHPADPAGRQRWARMLPIAFVTYSLAYLDRSNYSIGVAGGMKDDLGLHGATSAMICSGLLDTLR